MPVKGTMMSAAERDRELIADPSTQSLGLHESQVMGVARLPPAQKAGLRRHELQMGTIAIAARLAQGKRAFVNMPENGVVHRRQLGQRWRGRLRRDRWRPPLAPAPVRREGRVLGRAEFHARA
jgi:hypothetical protein